MNNQPCFMIDIETTSADKSKAQVLEIGIVACSWSKQGILLPKKKDPDYHTYLHYAGDPETNFAKEHQVELYALCNKTEPKDHELIREGILTFFKNHHAQTPVTVLGLNAASFDMPILSKHGILKESVWVDNEEGQDLVGDYHYRVEDITGARMMAMRVTGMNYGPLTNAAMALCPEIKLPEGKAHDALYDCYRQIVMYNGLIRLVRGGRMV